MAGGEREIDRSLPATAPTQRRRKRWRWVLIPAGTAIVVTVFVLLSVMGVIGFWASSSSTRGLARELGELELGRHFELVASEGAGSSGCLLADCLRLDHYYASDLTVSDACASAGEALAHWGEVRLDSRAAPQGVGDGCAFYGFRNGYEVIAEIRQDMVVESPGINEGQRRIRRPHSAVLWIELVEADEGERSGSHSASGAGAAARASSFRT